MWCRSLSRALNSIVSRKKHGRVSTTPLEAFGIRQQSGK